MYASKHSNMKHALRYEREQRGWSRGHVANLLGTNTFTIYRWESGRAFPNLYYRQRLSEVFGRSLDQLGLLERRERHPPFLKIASEREVERALPFPAYSTSSSHAPHNLIGRESCIQLLKKRIGEKNPTQPVCLALHGLPGVGKTALAAVFAHDEEVRQQFSDGILWIELGPHPDMLTLLSRWAGALGITSTDPSPTRTSDGLKQALQAAMSGRNMLVVIDDVWKLEDSFELNLGGPHCTYLLTTRFPLLAAQYAPRATFAIPELLTCDGLSFLELLAPEAVMLEREQMQELVNAVGGLPLALALIGNYLYLQGTSGQPRRIRSAIGQLHHRKERLTLTMPQITSGDGCKISLQATIAQSVERLSPPASYLLHALASFSPKPYFFSEEAAFARNEMTGTLFFSCIDELYDAGLIESTAPETYTLHPTIVDYMLEYGDGNNARSAIDRPVSGTLLLPQS